MNRSDIATLHALITTLDGRFQVDELKVEAWYETLDDDLPFQIAKTIVINHYGDTADYITPSHLNKTWRTMRVNETARAIGQAITEKQRRAEQEKASPERVEEILGEIREKLRQSSFAEEGKDDTESS